MRGRFGSLNYRFSFNTKLIASLAAILLLIFSLGGYISYRLHLQLFEAELSKQVHKANEQAMARMELQIQQIYRTSNSMVFHPYVVEILQRSNRQNDSSVFEHYYDREQLKELLDTMRLDAPKLTALYLYDLNGQLVYDNSNQSIDPIVDREYVNMAKIVEGTEGGHRMGAHPAVQFH